MIIEKYYKQKNQQETDNNCLRECDEGRKYALKIFKELDIWCGEGEGVGVAVG